MQRSLINSSDIERIASMAFSATDMSSAWTFKNRHEELITGLVMIIPNAAMS